MTVKTVITCPLGSECEKIVGDTIQKCMWHIRLAGKNPGTGEEIDEYGCAMAWIPILLIENSRAQISTAAAVESFRNEMVDANKSSQELLALTANINVKKIGQ